MLVRLTKLAPMIAALALLVPYGVQADPATERHHALSLIGKPSMPADYKAFDWVNPDAPKGGVFREAATGSYDSLNDFTVNGDKADGLSADLRHADDLEPGRAGDGIRPRRRVGVAIRQTFRPRLSGCAKAPASTMASPSRPRTSSSRLKL